MIEWRHDIINVGVIMQADLPKWKQNKYEYTAQWQKENLEQLKFNVPKGKKAELKALAERENTTVKGLFSQALEAKYGINLDRKKD